MTGSEKYNFCYPLDLSKLQDERVKLVPFDSNTPLFSHHYVLHTSEPAALNNFRYLPYGPFATTDDFLAFYNKVISPSDATVWFSILVSSEGGKEAQRQRRDAGVEAGDLDESLKLNVDGDGEFFFAGTIGLLNASSENAVCEIGHINILPWSQRTFITTTANALLLHYLLDPPSQGCLGIRRVTWLANAKNQRSVAAAQRLGFHLEGIMRWHRILPEGKDGEKPQLNNKDEGGEMYDDKGPGRDTAMLAMCWDDWRDGGREKVRTLMGRGR